MPARYVIDLADEFTEPCGLRRREASWLPAPIFGEYFHAVEDSLIQQLRIGFRILEHRRHSEMPPFLRLVRARSFRLVHTLFRIHAKDQPERHLIAVRQLHNQIRDLARIAFLTSFDTSQQLEYRADRGLIVRQ